jgi:hypothetical protein
VPVVPPRGPWRAGLLGRPVSRAARASSDTHRGGGLPCSLGALAPDRPAGGLGCAIEYAGAASIAQPVPQPGAAGCAWIAFRLVTVTLVASEAVITLAAFRIGVSVLLIRRHLAALMRASDYSGPPMSRAARASPDTHRRGRAPVVPPRGCGAPGYSGGPYHAPPAPHAVHIGAAGRLWCRLTAPSAVRATHVCSHQTQLAPHPTHGVEIPGSRCLPWPDKRVLSTVCRWVCNHEIS